MTRAKVGVIGSGNIRTDPMIKVRRLSEDLEMGAMVGNATVQERSQQFFDKADRRRAGATATPLYDRGVAAPSQTPTICQVRAFPVSRSRAAA
jgi:acetaldehyde dehydrogenase (acetylating)